MFKYLTLLNQTHHSHTQMMATVVIALIQMHWVDLLGQLINVFNWSVYRSPPICYCISAF